MLRHSATAPPIGCRAPLLVGRNDSRGRRSTRSGPLLPSWQPDWVRHLVGTLPAVFQSPAPWTANDGVQIVVRANSMTHPPWIAIESLRVVWAAGTAILLLRLATEAIKLALLTHQLRRSLDEPWHQTANDVAHALRLARPITLMEGKNGVAPMTWGLWQPRSFSARHICIMVRRTQACGDRSRLAHVSRGDWIVQVASEVVCAVDRFHPLFWLAKKRLGQESEHACDDVVLGLGVDRDDYATHLLEIARAARGALQPACPTVAMARPSDPSGDSPRCLDQGQESARYQKPASRGGCGDGHPSDRSSFCHSIA